MCVRHMNLGLRSKRLSQKLIGFMNLAQKSWIDGASYKVLSNLIRNESPDSPWFFGETGKYLSDVFMKKQKNRKIEITFQHNRNKK